MNRIVIGRSLRVALLSALTAASFGGAPAGAAPLGTTVRVTASDPDGHSAFGHI